MVLVADEGSWSHAPILKMAEQCYQQQTPKKLYRTVMRKELQLGFNKEVIVLNWPLFALKLDME